TPSQSPQKSRFSVPAGVAVWVGAMGLTLTAACGDTKTGDGGNALLLKVQDMDYSSWERAPGYPGIADSDAPHGGYVEIYINEVVAAALVPPAEGEALTEWPVGSIIVKDGWEDAEGSDRSILAIMEKREGGWYYEEYVGTNEDSPKFAGDRIATCMGCHSSGADFVRAFGFP
ncbi:MAG: cytochrome P460 family protein, partial [Nannocystaceae bacterium]